jgi:hypothetical protein
MRNVFQGISKQIYKYCDAKLPFTAHAQPQNSSSHLQPWSTLLCHTSEAMVSILMLAMIQRALSDDRTDRTIPKSWRCCLLFHATVCRYHKRANSLSRSFFSSDLLIVWLCHVTLSGRAEPTSKGPRYWAAFPRMRKARSLPLLEPPSAALFLIMFFLVA